MNVLVTGAGGYIGSALVPALDDRPGTLVTFTHPATSEHAVIHLACATAGDFWANVAGVASVVAAMPHSSRFIFASSLAATGPRDQYEREKALGEQIVQSRPDITAVILRLGNVYGGGPQSKRCVLNQLIRKAVAGERLELYGNANGARDYVHVDDVVRAFVLALDAPPGVYDVGTASTNSLTTAAMIVCEEAGAKEWPVTAEGISAAGNHHQLARESRFVPGWAPRIGLREGIRQTIAWVREHEPARELVAA